MLNSLLQNRVRVAYAVGTGAVLTLITVLGALAQQPTGATAPLPDQVDYNWDIRPILSDTCFQCHGPDEKSRRAGLRLDTAESAYAQRGNPPHQAIVPGKPDESELVKRILHEDARRRMPLASSNKKLTERQIALLKKWIAQGATYKPHWAFIPPALPTTTQLKATGLAKNEIDRFIISRLEREGLQLSPEADKETLINRVTLTLTGLPPTLAEVDAFLADKSQNAYEKVVDRLLASPAYGEHMASYWMDLARYSESDGFLDDYHDRLFWPYRDWVISAFNRNMPFDQFGTWQIAGDLLPNQSKEQRQEQTLATAFLRVGKRTTENGAIDEEYRVEYAVDRTNTIGTAFLGLTTGCARCHDHKYDPIPQRDFYALSGFFNSTDEPGFYAPGGTGITPGPTIPWTDAEADAKLASAEAKIQERESAYNTVRAFVLGEAKQRAAALISKPTAAEAAVKDSVEKALVAYYPFEEVMPIPDDKLPRTAPKKRPAPASLAPETNSSFYAGPPPTAPPKQTATPAQVSGDTKVTAKTGEVTGEQLQQLVRTVRNQLPADLVRDSLMFSPSGSPGVEPAVLEAPALREGVKGKAFFFDDTNRGFLAANVGLYERTQPFSIDLWVYAAQVYDDATVFNHREDNNQGNAGYQLQLDQNHLQFDLMHSRAGNLIRVVTKETVPLKKWTHVTVTYDGSSKAKGAAVYIDGQRADAEIVSDNLTRTMIPNGGGLFGGEFMGIMFGKRFRFTPMKDGAIDELRVFRRALEPIEIQYLQEQALPATPSASQAAQVENLLVENDPRVTEAAAKLIAARTEHNDIFSKIPEVPVMGDTLKPRPTYLLQRGVYTEHGPELQPQGLTQIFPWDESLPRNRIGLSQWLFDPKHPLTARVFVNRLWQRQFGRGLVETSEDFGAQGSIPSHPELLDWLAVSFRESGWDMKRIQRLMVMSAAYRQSSDVSDTLLKQDPRNILLARFTRVRMPAEMVRDNALAASGLLVKTIGGKSAYPYQPNGIWDGLVQYAYPAAGKVPQDDQHRRSLYSFIKRNAPHPAMAMFDLPDRGSSIVRRQTSNTPLQALVLLDDPQFLEAYRALATQVLKGEADQDAQLRRVFRLATRREPRANEQRVLAAYYSAQLQRYDRDRQAATEVLMNGVTPLDTTIDLVKLAALTNVTAVVMNTPDAYSLR